MVSIQCSLPNTVTTPKLQLSRLPSETVFTIEEDSNVKEFHNQSNSYHGQLSSARRYDSFDGVQIPDMRPPASFTGTPRLMTKIAYPPIKIPGALSMETPTGIDAFIRDCCTCWVVLGGIFLVFDIFVIGVVFYYFRDSECCGDQVSTLILGLTVSLAVYFIFSIYIFASVHGGEVDTPPYGECKEIVQKVFNIIILVIFLSLIFWTLHNNKLPKICELPQKAKNECPNTMQRVITLWIYSHAFILCIRIVTTLMMPHTRVRNDPPQAMMTEEPQSLNPDVQHVIESIKSQSKVMDFPSATKSVVRSHLSSEQMPPVYLD